LGDDLPNLKINLEPQSDVRIKRKSLPSSLMGSIKGLNATKEDKPKIKFTKE